jgi:hypothetical protein
LRTTCFPAAHATPLEIGRDANKTTELGDRIRAKLKTGGIHINATASTAPTAPPPSDRRAARSTITYSDGLFIRDYGTSAGRNLMNGGTFSAPANSWTSMGRKAPPI